MLIADYTKKIGFLTIWNDEGKITSQPDIFYSPNALFVVCDEHKNLLFFAVDIQHLKNMLGLSKEFKDNMFKNYSFTFESYPYQREGLTKDEYNRMKHIFLEIHKLVCFKDFTRDNTSFSFNY